MKLNEKMMILIRINVAFVLLFFCSSFSYGQNTNNNWYFGDGNFLDFNTPAPTITSNGVQIATPTTTYCIEGTSSISNTSGQLLFYSDGRTVWDKNYNQMPNGTGLNGHRSTAQVLIVPKPGSNDIYYIFYADFAGDANGFSYTEVDMSLNGGLGDVTGTKNIQLHTPSAEMMKAVIHCNGTDIWVLSHDALGNTFRAYLVTPTGVNTTAVISTIGAPFPSVFTGTSYMTCRKDGKKIAINMDTTFEIYDFDNQNGTLCSPISVPTNGFGGYGIEYSEDGTKIYISDNNLYQFDVSSNNAATIASTKVTYAMTEPAAIMRGPDNKIYVAGGCDYYDTQTQTMYSARDIHVIQNPNLAGTAASNLVMNVFATPRECGIGLPTIFIPTQTTSTCGPVLTANASVSNNTICINDCVNYTNLSLGPAVSYIWTFAGGTPTTFSGLNPPQVCYAVAGNYITTLDITDCAGNTSTINLTITVENCISPVASFTPSQTILCEGDCINFTENSTGVNINSWSWTFAGGIPLNFNGSNPGQVCFNSAGTYNVTLTITDDNGTGDSTMVITVNACIPPTSDFSISDDEICEGECVSFTDLSSEATNWNWIFNGGSPNSSTTQNPGIICFNTNGVYTVELTVTNSYGSNTIVKTITVHSNPTINLGSDIVLDQGDEVTITATGSSGQYSWTPQNIFSCSNCNSQTFLPNASITVIASIIDLNGCSASDEILITVDNDYIIFSPNSFTPGTDGLNDGFGPVCNFDIDDYNLMIFSRWGEVVFESKNINNFWYGKIKGEDAPSGIYVWKISGRVAFTYEYINEIGHVNIIR
jgi:gliding motility-associated-like protein